jgi:ABC-type antimicrobial peptide transport system permease subunit
LYGRSVAVALSVGVAAALVPARNAGRMDPATVIRNG